MIKEYEDFIIRYEAHSHYIDFEVFRAIGWSKGENGDFTIKNYEKKEAISSMDDTENLDEAAREFAGSVKWDGCSNFEYLPDAIAMIHFCGREDIKRFSDMLIAVYDLAKEVLKQDI